MRRKVVSDAAMTRRRYRRVEDVVRGRQYRWPAMVLARSGGSRWRWSFDRYRAMGGVEQMRRKLHVEYGERVDALQAEFELNFSRIFLSNSPL